MKPIPKAKEDIYNNREANGISDENASKSNPPTDKATRINVHNQRMLPRGLCRNTNIPHTATQIYSVISNATSMDVGSKLKKRKFAII